MAQGECGFFPNYRTHDHADDFFDPDDDHYRFAEGVRTNLRDDTRGPSGSTKVLVYNIWERAFKLFEFGYASALAYVLFVITLLLTLAQWQMRKRWVLNES